MVDLTKEGREVESVRLGRVVEDDRRVVLDFGHRHGGGG